MQRCLASRHADWQKPAIWLFLPATLLLTTASPSIWGQNKFLLHCSCPCCCSCLPCKDIYRSTEASLAILPVFALYHVCRSEANSVLVIQNVTTSRENLASPNWTHNKPQDSIRCLLFRDISALEGYKIWIAAGEWWILRSWKHEHESGS